MNWHRDQRRLRAIAAREAANTPEPVSVKVKPSNRYERMMARRKR